MKKRILFPILALLVFSLCLTACGNKADKLRATREVSFEGTELTVKLGTNKTTGYEWSFRIEGDCIQQSINKSFKVIPVDGDATGIVSIGFEGLSEGTAKITLTTPVGWDGAGAGDAYTVDVTVGADGAIVSATGS